MVVNLTAFFITVSVTGFLQVRLGYIISLPLLHDTTVIGSGSAGTK